LKFSLKERKTAPGAYLTLEMSKSMEKQARSLTRRRKMKMMRTVIQEIKVEITSMTPSE